MGFWTKSRLIFNFFRDHAKASIRQIAMETGFSKSSVHRLRQALERRDVHPESWLWETEEGRRWQVGQEARHGLPVEDHPARYAAADLTQHPGRGRHARQAARTHPDGDGSNTEGGGFSHDPDSRRCGLPAPRDTPSAGPSSRSFPSTASFTTWVRGYRLCLH